MIMRFIEWTFSVIFGLPCPGCKKNRVYYSRKEKRHVCGKCGAEIL